MKLPSLTSRRRSIRNRTLFAALAAMTLGSQALMADLTLALGGSGSDDIQSGTITVTLGSTEAPVTNQVFLVPGTEMSPQRVSGTLPGLSGSFDVSFQAYGTSAENFVPADFTGGDASVNHTSTTWGVRSDINPLENTFPGQGIVFSFDFSNLVGASSIDLKSVLMQNDSDGARLNFRAGGSGTSTVLYGGGVAGSSNQTVTLDQALSTSDQVGFWSTGGGQRRMKAFTFSFVPEGITAPVNLTASTNGVEVGLNWDDDLSGTLAFYSVFRSETEGGPFTTPIATNLLTSEYTDTTVATGTTYYYVVTATDDVGPTESGPSNERSIDVVIQRPTGLVATQGDSVIDLDWNDNTSGILGFYSVYRSETAGVFEDPPIATNLLTSEYSDTDVTNGTTYYYVVTATDNVVAIESANSNQVVATPFVPVPTTELYTHLDATELASVTVENSNEVTEWADLTANGFNATPAVGSVFYPSVSVSDSGLEGLEFGSSGKTTLTLFDTAGQNTWLNFASGAGALPYTGFAVFVAVHTESILGGINRDVVMGNIETKFSIRYENGRPRLFFGGTILQNTAGAVEVAETVIFAVNYNASTGETAFWDSQSGVTATATVPATDFSASADFFLGGSVNGDQYMNGMIGEVMIYRGTMDATTFASERNALTFKWAGLTAPVGLVATPGDSTVELDWSDQDADSYNVYRDFNLIAENVTSSNYTDTMLTNGITYEYSVEAVKDGEIGPESDFVTATPFAFVTESELYVHLDATDAASVTVENTNEVLSWADLTSNGINAVKDAGILLYPSDSLSPTSLSGLDTGDGTKNTLFAFTSAEQDAWLNFTDPAGALPYTGFAAFVVFKADAILGTDKRDIVFANNGNPSATTGSFVMKYEGGIPQAVLGGQTASRGNAVVEAGDTVVLAGNYDVATGEFELWDSENAASATITVAVGDFSSTQNMFLGGSLNPTQSMDGMIGEVKIYRGAMTPAEFEAERNALSLKWLGAIPVSGFSSWISGPFANGSVPEDQQGPDDDFDEDGISNLLEYGIAGEDPTVPNAAVGTLTDTSLSFTKRDDAVGLTYAIQESTDLGVSDDWTEVTGETYVNDVTTISFGFTPGTPAANFLRLEITN
ncbi:hypothetical protein [Haloferula sp.]|uniref:hypothetical protein n=1 Tax=Haloferula sp. TaxID=2497595 RepID=UPI003C76E021